MKIVVFNWRDRAHPAAGGAEVYTEEVLTRWAAAGHTVTLFSSAVADRPAVEHRHGIEHVRRGGRFSVYRAARQWWADEGRRRGYDLVVDEVNTRPFGCHQWAADHAVVALFHQLAREVWFHEMPLPVAAAGRFVLEPRWLRSMRDVPCLTVSESSRRSLVAAGLTRVCVTPQGITTPGDKVPAAAEKESVPTVVFVGRLAANKRPDHAADAVEMARGLVPDLRLWLIGDGPERRRLAERGDHITAHGFVSAADKRHLVSRAHALVVTSVREGWGLVVDEAAHAGTPTIGYDVPGLRDSVPAAGGVLVEPRPEALAEALIERLPALVAQPRRTGWAGGAVGWDVVADEALRRALTVARISSPRPVGPVDLRSPSMEELVS